MLHILTNHWHSLSTLSLSDQLNQIMRKGADNPCVRLLNIDPKYDEYRPLEVDWMKEAHSKGSVVSCSRTLPLTFMTFLTTHQNSFLSLSFWQHHINQMAEKGTNCIYLKVEKNCPIMLDGTKKVLAKGNFVSYWNTFTCLTNSGEVLLPWLHFELIWPIITPLSSLSLSI